MKTVSVDAGALSGQSHTHYGNYTFSKELIQALLKYDQNHSYRFYLQEPSHIVPQKNSVVIKPKLGWLKLGISVQELNSPSQVFLALNQALPWYYPAKKIVFCHGTAPLDFPKLYPDSQKRMRKQIKQMLEKADWIVVGSKKLMARLNDIYREEKREEGLLKIKVINYGIGQDFLDYQKTLKLPKIVCVGSSHPIKNLPFIFKTFAEFIKIPEYGNYRLSIIGIKEPLNIPKEIRKQVEIVGYLQPKQLCLYYRQAQCLVTASLEESFNLPVLEALSQQTPVVGTQNAIIPEFVPYVNIAPSSPKLFAQKIIKTVKKTKKIDLEKLRQQFSWQHYVQKLQQLYEEN